MNIKKSSVHIGIAAAVICLLSVLVARYSYLGENPLQSSLVSVGLMFAAVVTSAGGVWITKHLSWRKWTAYITPAILLTACSVASYIIWDFLPNREDAHWWFNTLICMAAASLMIALLTAHVVFGEKDVYAFIRSRFPLFTVVPNEDLMNQPRWNADQELLLECKPHESIFEAFVGAGNDVTKLLCALLDSPSSGREYKSFYLSGERTKILPSGKQLRRVTAHADNHNAELTLVLDPEQGDGILVRQTVV